MGWHTWKNGDISFIWQPVEDDMSLDDYLMTAEEEKFVQQWLDLSTADPPQAREVFDGLPLAMQKKCNLMWCDREYGRLIGISTEWVAVLDWSPPKPRG